MDNAVALVQAYLRFNGFFTVTEFQVQRRVAGRPDVFETATDLDILAVRLPWAAETTLRGTPRPGVERTEIILAADPLLDVSSRSMDLIIGEVKEGIGELNQRLRTTSVLHTAVRRAGCCPEDHLDAVVAQLTARGETRVSSAEGSPCRVRLASFCGTPASGGGPAILTVTLAHMVAFVQERLHAYAPIVRGVTFKDPVLDLLKLLWKLGIELRPPVAQR